MAGFSSRRERLRQQAASVDRGPAEPVALGVMIATSLVCVLAVSTGLAVVSWRMFSARVPATQAPPVVDVGADSSYVYVYDNQDIYWQILGESPTEKPKTPGTTRVPDPVTSDAELSQLAQRLWDADANRFPDDQYTLHLQGHTNQSETRDRANRRLFNSMNADPVTWSGTYTRFVSLLDNYEITTRRADGYSLSEKAEIDGFLDEILKTEVVRYLEDFLMRKGYISHEEDSLRHLLKSLWFEMYNRSPRYNITDSCGFEHVFAGEIKKNKVIGFHSWVRFYLEEREGNIDYQGYISYDSVGGDAPRRVSVNRARGRQRLPPGIINVRMLWRGKPKKQASFFMGTSPEFDISVYTLCILARTNRDCVLTINQSEVPIKTLDAGHVAGLQVASSFPAV